MTRYFYAVHAQADKENEISFFIIPPQLDKPPEKIPELTADMVKKHLAYAEFAKNKFPMVYVDYTIYNTDADLSQADDERMNALMESELAALVVKSDFTITSGKNKIKVAGDSKPKKKISQNMMYAIIGGAAVVSLIIGVGIGMNFSGKNGANSNKIDTLINESDGLIMPDAVEFAEGAELITITIDRSYFAVPKEDIQLKGEVIDGIAAITLPTFDRSEFFSHVSGHTWGFTTDPAGTKIEYYGGQAYNFTQPVKLYRVLVKYGGGNGTKDDPYLINYFDQLTLMSQEKARGYFRQTEDIEFPVWATHTPINTVNELKLAPDAEYFEYDGGGYFIQGLTAPLFGKVSGSVIKNVNITNSVIETAEYKNYGFLVCEAYNYRYDVDGKAYETGETLIKNCTVSSAAIYIRIPTVDENGNPIPETVPPAEPPPVVPPDVELTDEQFAEIYNLPPKHGEFVIGGITGLGGQIENCYVTEVEVFAGLGDYFLYVGGVSGKPANVINSGVCNLLIGGNIFNAGGIAGSAGGSRLYSADGGELPVYYGGNIQGCYVRGFSGYVENSAGGIAAEASTNAENALISNSYATGLYLSVGIFEDIERNIPIKPGISGGIIGSDGNENNGHLITNCVSVMDYAVIGKRNKSEYDDTVRLAPYHAFYQAGILDVLNKNTVTPNNPKEIFTGSFMFAEDGRNTDQSGSDEGGSYAMPGEIADLVALFYVAEGEQNQ